MKRNFIVYVTVSASGPDSGVKVVDTVSEGRTRSAADLAFTTSDCDRFYKHFRDHPECPTTAAKHIRLINPSKLEVTDAISAACLFLEQHSSRVEWDGGQIEIIYAGHGRKGDGAWYLNDEYLRAEELCELISYSIPETSSAVRVDLTLDSCYSGAFVVDFLVEAWNSHRARVIPWTLFAGAMHDEEARENPDVAAGYFTHAYFSSIDPVYGKQVDGFNDPAGLMTALSHQLAVGGPTVLSKGLQHSLDIENWMFRVKGFGEFEYRPEGSINRHDIFTRLEEARKHEGGIHMAQFFQIDAQMTRQTNLEAKEKSQGWAVLLKPDGNA